MRLRTALLALIPGAAHIDLGRVYRGIGYFFLFTFFLNGALIAPFLTGEERVRLGCAAAAAMVWALAFSGALRASRAASGGPPQKRSLRAEDPSDPGPPATVPRRVPPSPPAG